MTTNDDRVLGALASAKRPLSAYDILECAGGDSLRAPVQVYRSLKRLETSGRVHRIETLNAFVACHGSAHTVHRPGFVICRTCRSTREFHDERVGAVAMSAAGAAFRVENVSLEIFGQCGACRSGVPSQTQLEG